MADIIETKGLVKRFGEITALKGLDLNVPEGTVLGLLGPNGAGKTTAVRILTTLLLPDEGEVTVAGLDVIGKPAEVRKKIGLSGQSAAVDEYLTGYENLEMVGRLYHLGRDEARRRARELLTEFDLTEAADRTAKTYSGGMRRRLDLAAALVAKPPVLFLDEPTTGLDPRSRSQMWETIQQLVRGGSTVLLTTQYMEEAERLADDIVVIDRGRVIAHGTTDQLKSQTGGERVEMAVGRESDIPVAESVLNELSNGDIQIDEQTRTLTAAVTGGPAILGPLLDHLRERDVEIADIGLRRPTLDDVFLRLTGHTAHEAEAEVAPDSTTERDKEAV